MSNFTQSIRKVFQNAGKSFKTFPAVMVNAVLFTLVSLVRIAMDWQTQQPYNFLFNTLHASLALGAVFSLAAITYAKSRINTKQSFLMANLAGLIVPAVTFLLLYFFGGYYPKYEFQEGTIYKAITVLAGTRVLVGGLISLLGFLLFAGRTKDGSDFSGSLFMTLKAFFLALIYGLVILIGVSGVFGAIQALLYNNMRGEVYQVVTTLSGFVGFSIFIGYFPDFRKDAEDEHRLIAQQQPRFITILLEYILVPIMLALTVVLILWAGQTILGGMNTRFINLYSIATAFAIGGLLLHILITKNDSALAKFYKKVFPIAALFILLFEAWALITQFNKYGLKTAEYLFTIVWIIAFASFILLILKQEKAHRYMVYVTSVLAVIAVLPLVGFTDLPFMEQINRLESTLKRENMLQNDTIVPAAKEPARETKEVITETVDYLINAEGAIYPTWLDPVKLNYNNFRTTMGFERLRAGEEPQTPDGSQSLSLMLDTQILDIKGYEWALNSAYFMKEAAGTIQFNGRNGKYDLIWTQQPQSIPVLEVKKDGVTILKGDLKPFIDQTLQKYPLGSKTGIPETTADLTYLMESDQVAVLVVLQNLEINAGPENAKPVYFINLNSMYVKEKP